MVAQRSGGSGTARLETPKEMYLWAGQSRVSEGGRKYPPSKVGRGGFSCSLGI